MSDEIFCDSDEVVTTRTSRHWLGKDGILRAATLPGTENELDDAITNVAVLAKLGGGVRRPLLVDMRKTKGSRGFGSSLSEAAHNKSPEFDSCKGQSALARE